MSPPPLTRQRRLQSVFGMALYLAAAIVLAAGFALESLAVPLTPWRWPPAVAIPAGLMIFAMGILARWISPKASLAACFTIYGLIALFAVGHRPPRRGDTVLAKTGLDKVYSSEESWCEIHLRPDAILGQRGIPNVAARQHSVEYDVSYTLDEEGWRKIPASPIDPAAPEIVFLGCSFTFGVGVADEENYPAILAAEAWPEYRVRNLALSGWGTNHCCVLLETILNEIPLPRCVFYGYISDHLKRNYLRRSWHSATHGWFPLFEWRSARLDFQGIVHSDKATLADTVEVASKEDAITFALIRRMNEMCQAKGIGFVCLVLQNLEDRVVKDLKAERGPRVLDLSEINYDYFLYDGHPKPSWHREIARAIASSREVADAAGDPALYQPSRVRAAEVDLDAWRLDVLAPARAFLDRGNSDQETTRARIESTDGRESSVLLKKHRLPMRKGESVTLMGRARADRPRSMMVSLQSGHPPFHGLGCYQRVQIGAEWTTFEWTNVVADSDDNATLCLLLGESTGWVEVAAVRLKGGDREIRPVPWQPPGLAAPGPRGAAPDETRTRTVAP